MALHFPVLAYDPAGPAGLEVFIRRKEKTVAESSMSTENAFLEVWAHLRDEYSSKYCNPGRCYITKDDIIGRYDICQQNLEEWKYQIALLGREAGSLGLEARDDCDQRMDLGSEVRTLAINIANYAVNVSDYTKDGMINDAELAMAKSIAAHMINVYLSAAYAAFALTNDIDAAYKAVTESVKMFNNQFEQVTPAGRQ